MSHWIKNLKEQGKDLSQAYDELKKAYDKSVDTLNELAQGYGVRINKTEDQHHAMQRMAGNKLAELAKMNIRKKPCCWYF